MLSVLLNRGAGALGVMEQTVRPVNTATMTDHEIHLWLERLLLAKHCLYEQRRDTLVMTACVLCDRALNAKIDSESQPRIVSTKVLYSCEPDGNLFFQILDRKSLLPAVLKLTIGYSVNA